MPISPLLEQDSDSALNITTEQPLGSHTAARNELVYVDIRLSGLNAAAANFTARVEKQTSGSSQIKNEGPFVEPKFAAADTVYGPPLIGPIGLRSGEILVPKITSSNAADTSVTWAVDYYDAFVADVRSRCHPS